MSSSQALRRRALARGVELSGGPEQLAHHLGISVLKLTVLLQGASHVPEPIFLQVVDVLAHHDVKELIAAGPAKSVGAQHG